MEEPPVGFPAGPSGDVGLSLVRDPLAFLENMQREHGDVVGMALAGARVVLVSSPLAARHVMVDAASSFQKEGTAFFPGSSLAGEGLLVSDGEVWRRQRRLSNPAFREAAVQGYVGAMTACMSDLLEGEWQDARGRARDVYADFNDLTLRVATRALFGEDATGPAAERINSAIALAFEYFGQRAATGFAIPEWVPTPGNSRYNAAVRDLDEAVYGIIAKRRAALDAAPSGAPQPNDLLTRLILARDDEDEGGGGMDDRSLRDELMTLLVAGQETSAIVLGWTCHMLAQRPSLQNEVSRSVRRTLRGRQPGWGDLPDLWEVEALLLESMRLMPPAYLVGRCAAEDVQVQGHRIPQGTTVLISPYLMHRDARYWDRPGDFRPDRWYEFLRGPGRGRGQLGSMALMSNLGPNGAYLPFGAGPRNCIGTRFALVETTLLLATILQRTLLRPPTGLAALRRPAVEAQPLITLRPGPIWLEVLLRPHWDGNVGKGRL
ncbi:unnamed protein product [Pedinophyceae sp. YPF-701]|nr:unnamed protein product [Pedinophyceae sp. YPF-701]